MKKIKALIWKEWREARLFFIASICLIVFVRLLLFLCKDIGGFDYAWWMLVSGNFVLPLGFTFFGAFVFTNEITEKTEDFLFTRCVSKRTLFWVKYLFGFGVVIFLDVLSYVLFYNPVLKFDPGTEVSPFILFIALLPFVAGLYMLLVLSSLLVKKPLITICFTPVLLLPVILCSFPYIGMSFYYVYNTWTCSDVIGVLLYGCLPLFLIVFIFIFTIYLWESAVTKRKNIWIQFLKCYIILCLIIWGSHFLLFLYSNYQVNVSIEELKKSGFKWGWTDAERKERQVLKKQLNSLLRQKAILDKRYKKEDDLIFKLKCKKNDPDKQKKILLIYRKIFSDPDYEKYFREANAFIKSLPENVMHSMNADENYYSHSTRISFLLWARSYSELLLSGIKINLEDKKYPLALSGIDVAMQLPFNTFYTYNEILFSYLDQYCKEFGTLDPLTEVDKSNLASMKNFCKSNYDIGDAGLQSEVDNFHRWYEAIIYSLCLDRSSTLIQQYRSKIFQNYICRPIISLIVIKKIEAIITLKRLQNQPFEKIADKLSELQQKLDLLRLRSWNMYFIKEYLITLYEFKRGRDLLKLVTALKVYKAENKTYPSQLTDLVPGILPELPFEPVTGKLYNYKKRGDGFILFLNIKSSRYKSFSQKNIYKFYIQNGILDTYNTSIETKK